MFPEDPFKGSGTLTLNTDHLPVEYEIYSPEKVGYSNIQKITTDLGLVKSGSAMIGIPTLGAFIATSQILTMESLHKAIEKMFGKSKYLEANHKAVEEAFKQTKVTKIERHLISN
jgi:Pyruvate/2-oxoacid:ferredoxin oxidoreductase gamma subunit